MIDRIDFDKMNGLIPAVVQDDGDNAVLMVGFMNREALRRTIDEQQVVFFSRTRRTLWRKGETSGNFLTVVSIVPDCDNDALLIRARPTGPVCHTGERSCFGANSDTLHRLSSLIKERRAAMPERSYTAMLFRDGIARIAQKVGEEAVELVVAAQHPDNRRVTEETADLVYHMLVLLAERQIDLGDVEKELKRRER